MRPDKNKGFWRGRAESFAYAWKGIGYLFAHERNAQFHLGVALAVVGAGLFLGLSATEWCLVSLSIGGMFMAEGLNTAVERLADRVCGEYDDCIGLVKDVAAGAVLLFTIGVIAIGIIIFVPKIWGLFC